MTTLRILGLCLGLLVSQPALAANLRVDFAGTIDDEYDENGEMGQLGSVNVGTPFAGYFTFNDSIVPQHQDPEQVPDAPAFALYEFASPAWTFHFEVGDYTVDADFPNFVSATGGYTITIYDSELNPTPDTASLVEAAAQVRGLSSDPGIEFPLNSVGLGLSGGAPGLPLHSTTLASVPWSLLGFPDADLGLAFSAPDYTGAFFVHGNVQELTVSVPEPASAALAAFAALALTGLGIARARS